MPKALEHVSFRLAERTPRTNDDFQKIDDYESSRQISTATLAELASSLSLSESAHEAVLKEPAAPISKQVSNRTFSADKKENAPTATTEPKKVVPAEESDSAKEEKTTAHAAKGTVPFLLKQKSGQSLSSAQVKPVKKGSKTPNAAATSSKAKEASKPERTVIKLPEPLIKEALQPEQAPLVAHLPSISKILPEFVKPLPKNVPYPRDGLHLLNPLLTSDAKESKKATTAIKSWPEPKTLLSLLDELAQTPQSSHWAKTTENLVRKLATAMARDQNEAETTLDRLEKLRVEAEKLADSITDFLIARKLRQAAFAIERRLDVWESVAQLGPSALVEVDKPSADLHRLAVCLHEIGEITEKSSEGRQWRNYMLFDAMKQWTSKREDAELDRQRALAKQVLTRLISTPMSTQQHQFITSEPVAALCAQLRRLAADPLTSVEVLADIERYEETWLPSDASRLGKDLLSLSQSDEPRRHELARSVESHYRNANLRVCLSQDFLNRLIPEQDMELAPVRETVLGLPVRGQSLTSREVALRLIPDPTHVRLALEVTGEVAAMTSSTSGPATFFDDSNSLYAATKPLEIDQKGIRLLPAEIGVRHQTRLRDVSTSFDRIPLLGWMARAVARSQHELVQPEASHEARWKVANKARDRIDVEAQKQLSKMVDNLNRNLFGPLYNLALEPTMLDAQTSDQRITMRLRIAGEDQLGSHTPRPQAPGDSLASFQINETLLNNALERLQLEGETFTLAQLVERISQR
ncbi:MAG: hypothetical protein ACWGMZ_00710, partial [Thermoguttaceae bacterium]